MITNAKIIGHSVNPEDYHKSEFERGDARFVVSSSQLREFYRCPSRWLAGYNTPESEAKTWGRLLETLLLTPEQFRDCFAVKPKTYTSEKGEVKLWNGNSSTCKAWTADHSHLEIIGNDECVEAHKAITRLMRDPQIAQYVEESDKQVYVSAKWRDEETGLTIPVKALLDLVPREDSVFRKTAVDLKSTRNASKEAWNKEVGERQYDIQAAFHFEILRAAMPERDLAQWGFILSENYPPYEPSREWLSEDDYRDAVADVKQMMSLYCQCVKLNKWPSYNQVDQSCLDGWGITKIPDYIKNRRMMRPRFEISKPEPETENQNDQGIIP